MAQPNQTPQPNGQTPRTVKIRWKVGKALIKRQYKLINGTTVDERPRSRDDVVDTVDTYLEAGQVAEVTLETLAGLLDKDNKPSRVVDGYPMTKLKGSVQETDDQGNPLPKPVVTEDTYTAGHLYFNGNELIASQKDCPFEIVNDSRAA
jgi:hypothetical protein